jgi:hypothetical protein
VRKQLIAIAENPMRPWHDEVLAIATLFTDNWDDELLRANFVDLVLQLAVEQPLKTPFVAAVVLVANAARPEVVDMLLVKLSGLIEEKIGNGEWRDVKLYLKLLGCLQGCLEGEGVFPVLEELFARAVDLQTASSEDVSCALLMGSAGCLLTGFCADDWHRDCQDYPPDPTLCHGGRAGAVGAKGGGPDGEDGNHCLGAAYPAESHRAVPPRDRGGEPAPVAELDRAAADPAPERGEQRVGAALLAEAVGVSPRRG